MECGHKFIDNRCELFCDDYVLSTKGICYLYAFYEEERGNVLKDLGEYPNACTFNLYYCKNKLTTSVSVIPPSEPGGCLHIQNEAIAGQKLTVAHLGECTNCSFQFRSYSNSLKPKMIDYCPSGCNPDVKTYHLISLIRFSYFANCVGSAFSVRNLILKEDSAINFEFREPRLYFSEDPMPTSIPNAHIEGDQVYMSINDSKVSYGRNSQKLKAFAHDFVANEWQENTDRPLSVLGVEGHASGMTPDFISLDTRCVLELATCNTDHFRALENSFQDKVLKYKNELEGYKVKFFVLVVSPQKVYTNLNISQKEVDMLSVRMRQTRLMRQKLIEVLGEDVMDSEYDEMERLTKRMFSRKYQEIDLADKYKYNLKEISNFRTDLTQSESTNAARILLKMFDDTRNVHSAGRQDLHDYISKFTPENSRCDMKRISNVPILLPGYDPGEIDGCLEGNETLKKMWCGSIVKNSGKDNTFSNKNTTLEAALMDKDPKQRHMTKRQMQTKLELSEEDKIELALSGVGGKKYRQNHEILEHKEQSKLSFHPHTYTEDISDFCGRNLLNTESSLPDTVPYLLKTAVRMSKTISCPDGNNYSVDIWESLLKTDFMQYSMLMTRLFMELAYTYKHWTSHYEFLYKDLGNGIYALVYNPKSAIFVSFAFPKGGAKLWDTGKLGPKCFFSRSHVFTDWASFDSSQLEHFIKFGPYMGSCLVELLNSSESSLTNYSKYAVECAPHLLLLYCNNKTDVEELVTSQRYLFMKLLEDVGRSPYVFIDRLPKVLRSRLTVFYLKKTIEMINYYDCNSITKVPRQGEDMIIYDYMNIKSLFSKEFISLNCKINEFYFGYVVSKERNTGKDKTFKVLTKLIKQEQKFRSKVKGSIFSQGEEYEEFKSNHSLIKFFSTAFRDLLVEKFGKDFQDKILDDFTHAAARTNFSDLATLKVSSRDHSKEVDVPVGDETTEQVFERLKKDFPEELMKRPFCMESMTQIIKQFEADQGVQITHISQLGPWCLESLLAKGHFDSDQFDKSQHGGEREIHVLEFKARIVQYFVELIARTICSYFPSETTINPDTKDSFVKDHYSRSKEMFGDNFTTISKSADATTWCQFHHVSHFSAMYQKLLPEGLLEFVNKALSLWPRKRLSFPLKQASSLSANVKLKTSNEVYMKFKEEFERGEGMFVKARSNLIEVISGMFQGILHTTSSLYHTMIQEVMKQVMLTACKGRLGMPKVHITVCQGSDDSGCMISLPGKPSSKNLQIAKRLLLWKERVSPYLSVFCNEAKSSIGTHDLIEYNSEWHVRHMIVKPTFRWVSASQELSVTERFIDRFRMYNNMLSECLSGGASTLECSVIQLFQATMHYSLLGLNTLGNQDIKIKYLELLFENPDPLHGFFPLDEDVSCGVTGVEFLLYNLYKRTSFGTTLRVLGDSETSIDYSPEDLPNWMKTKDMSSVRLKFSDMKIFYRILERMNLEPLEDAIKSVESDPTILFSRSNSWKDEQHNLVLKVFSKGVKESISNRSSMLRMSASSAYILTNRCFTVMGDNETEEIEYSVDGGKVLKKKVPAKHTLLYLMNRHRDVLSKTSKDISNLPNLFPYHKEYEKIASDIKNLKENGVVLDQYVKRTSKVKITVIPKASGDIDIIDMCKRQWFDRGVPSLSKGQFKLRWKELTEKFSFIDSHKGPEGVIRTAKKLNLNVVQTKMFLESMTERSRSIVLYDSATKGGNLSFSLSRMYWPNKKISLPTSNLDDKVGELRSSLFSVLTYWFRKDYTDEICKKLIRSAQCLDMDYSRTSTHGLKLKIMHDFLLGASKLDLLNRIETSKKGLLGSYVQMQRGKGSSRKGLGIWQGSICGIGTRMIMKDNICSHVIVNKIYDSVTLGWHLNQLMVESSLKMPEAKDIKDLPDTNCWLSHDGRILIGRQAKGVPIYQDTSMKTVGTDEIANLVWSIDTHNNNVRIRARDPISNTMITLLSDTLVNRDWIPGCSTDVDDPVFSKWSRGESLHLPTFQRILEATFPVKRYDFMKLKDDFNTNKLHNHLNWDYKQMQKVMRMSIMDRDYIAAVDKTKTDQSSLNDDEVLKKFSSMLSTMADEFDNGLDEEIGNWAEEVEMEEDYTMNAWGVDLSLEEEERIRESVSLFAETSTDKYFELVDKTNLAKNFSMPSSSRFFSTLDHSNVATMHEPIRNSILERRKAGGILGIVYTIILGEYSIGRDDNLTSEIVEIEEEMSNVSSSISRPGAMMNLTLDEVRVNIANIQNQMENSPKGLSKRLLRLLNIYKDREEEILNRLDPHTHDLIMLNSDSLLQQVISNFVDLKLLPIDISGVEHELRTSLFGTLTRSKITNCAELSSSEKEEAILQLTSGSISRGSIQSLCVAYDINMMLDGEPIHIANQESITIHLFI